MDHLPTMSPKHSQKELTKALSTESQGVNISIPGPPLNNTIANCFSCLYSRNTCSSLFHAAPTIANASQERGFLWKYLKLFKVIANMCGLALGAFSPIVTGAMSVCSPLFSPLWLWMTDEFLLYFHLLTSKLSGFFFFLQGVLNTAVFLQRVLYEGSLVSLTV